MRVGIVLKIICAVKIMPFSKISNLFNMLHPNNYLGKLKSSKKGYSRSSLQSQLPTFLRNVTVADQIHSLFKKILNHTFPFQYKRKFILSPFQVCLLCYSLLFDSVQEEISSIAVPSLLIMLQPAVLCFR